MGATTFKKIDRQRYKKIYPAKRRTPRSAVISDKPLILESEKINFTEASGETAANYKFKNVYETVPTITYGVTSNNGDMVIVRVTAISTQEVFLEVSAPFEGSVDIQILEIRENP